MKFTKRESFLLKLFGFIVLIALTYNFVIAPQLERLSNIRTKLAEKTHEADSVKQEIKSLPQLEEEVYSLSQEIKGLSSSFFPGLEQRNLIVILDEQFRASGAVADSFDFSKLIDIDKSILINSENNNQEQSQTKEVSSNPKENTTFPDIKSISIDIPFLGTFPQIMNFISQLEDMDRYLVINNLQMSQETDGNIRGIINLEFYSLKKLIHDYKDNDYLKWPYNTPRGTNNPFRFISSSAEEPLNEEPIAEDENSMEDSEEDTTLQEQLYTDSDLESEE